MIYLIDSTVTSSNKVMFKAVDFFEKYGVKYKILSTYKKTRMGGGEYTPKLYRELAAKIVRYFDYNIKEICKSPNSSYIQAMHKISPQAKRDLNSGRIYDMTCSQFIDWISEHPYFLKITVLYDDKRDIIISHFNEDDLRMFIPKEYRSVRRDQIQYTVLSELGLASPLEEDQPGFKSRKKKIQSSI
nr:MAG TPA: ArsC-like protein [Caudoviricetes sp.]